MTLAAELDVRGTKRKVLMHAPKNGFFYVLDRKSGEVLSAEPYVTVTWAKSVDLKTGRPARNCGRAYAASAPSIVAPGAGGAHNWHPMAFSPHDGGSCISRPPKSSMLLSRGGATGANLASSGSRTLGWISVAVAAAVRARRARSAPAFADLRRDQALRTSCSRGIR